jgi:hypothetical protein
MGPRSLIAVYEAAVGYRVNRFQLLKFGYELERTRGSEASLYHTAAIQFVTTWDALSIAGK